MMKKLELIFENELGKNVKYTLDSPIEPADAEAVSAAMDTIIEQDVFHTTGGDLVGKKQARIVDRQVTDIEIDIEGA